MMILTKDTIPAPKAIGPISPAPSRYTVPSSSEASLPIRPVMAAVHPAYLVDAIENAGGGSGGADSRSSGGNGASESGLNGVPNGATTLAMLGLHLSRAEPTPISDAASWERVHTLGYRPASRRCVPSTAASGELYDDTEGGDGEGAEGGGGESCSSGCAGAGTGTGSGSGAGASASTGGAGSGGERGGEGKRVGGGPPSFSSSFPLLRFMCRRLRRM
ncbi:unnamed protein product [Tilletia controversa]|nr:unnamed protein product [Tilletia controversa]